ncbi:MAG TPA: 4-(cytidine 5'-diphospho)-2-C-methyl-D-erythritol kinase [Devosia sp.]|nr:4-(cytidine 5'-diphospho)-2-C-methyl-D-erythritol kinase [Devosia sp.]
MKTESCVANGTGRPVSEWITGFAPAKVNLALHVIGQRPDGLHQLQSLVVFAGTGDRLLARAGTQDSLVIGGPFAGDLDGGEQNLVLAVIDAYRERFPARLPQGIEVRLTKNLPVAAGVGGGSSDAAAMLRILEQLAETPPPRSGLIELAAQLGADVPVCLSAHAQLMQGVGEKLHRFSGLPRACLVLINPGVAIPTQAVFDHLVDKRNSHLPTPPPGFSSARALADWLQTTRNDLVCPARKLVPEIEEVTDFLEQQQECLFTRMSGSGATVFGLFGDKHQAAPAVKAAQKLWPQYWIASAPMLE